MIGSVFDCCLIVYLLWVAYLFPIAYCGGVVCFGYRFEFDVCLFPCVLFPVSVVACITCLLCCLFLGVLCLRFTLLCWVAIVCLVSLWFGFVFTMLFWVCLLVYDVNGCLDVVVCLARVLCGLFVIVLWSKDEFCSLCVWLGIVACVLFCLGLCLWLIVDFVFWLDVVGLFVLFVA